jgi:hypothetical protein
MLKLTLFTLLATLIATPTMTQACTLDGNEGFLPENKLLIPESPSSVHGLSETQFQALIHRVEGVYTPIFAKIGKTYKIIPKWKSGKVNAYARRSGNISEVHLYGGFARHPKMTPDGFTLVICHETGHHLGGAPSTLIGAGEIGLKLWMSSEGQADYFATLKCAREVWKGDDNITLMAKKAIPQIVTERCQKAFDHAEEIALCQRTALAAQEIGTTLAALMHSSEPSLDTPDPHVVRFMKTTHPKAQCRVDTYFAGAVCSKSKDIPLSTTDVRIGTCTQESGEILGVRPLCWYRPSVRE